MQRHQQAVVAVVHHLAASPDVGGDDRKPAGGGLHGRARESLAVGGKHVEVETGIEVLDVVTVPAEDDVAQRAGGGDVRGVESVVPRPVLGTDHHEHHLGPDTAHVTRRLEQLPKSLLPNQATHRPHHDGRGVDAEGGPGPADVLIAPAGSEAAQVDPVAQKLCLVGGEVRRFITSRSSGFWKSSMWEQVEAALSMA